MSSGSSRVAGAARVVWEIGILGTGEGGWTLRVPCVARLV